MSAEATQGPIDIGAALRDHALALIGDRAWRRAAEICAAFRMLFPDLPDGYVLGLLCLREAGAVDAALALARDGIARFPREVRLRVEQGLIHFDTRDWPAARDAFAAIRADFPDAIDAYARGAAAARELALWPETLALLKAGHRRFPTDLGLLDHLAEVSELEGRWADAIEARAALHALSGRDSDLLAQATGLSHLGDDDAAVALLRAHRTARPDRLETPLALARFASSTGDWADAEQRWAEVAAHGGPGAEEAPFRIRQAEHFRALRSEGLPPDAPAIGAVTARGTPHVPLDRILQARWDLAIGADRFAASAIRLSRYGEVLRLHRPYAGWELRGEAICLMDETWHVAVKLFPDGETEHGLLRYAGRDLRRLDQPVLIRLDERGADIGTLISRFESIGDNCEFGLVQRYYRREPMGLFRFNYASLEALLRGLSDRFSLLEDPDCVHVERFAPGTEWIGLVPAYGFRYHTHRLQDFDPAELARSEHRRLLFLRDKFFEDLADSRKILVRKNEAGADPDGMRRLRDAIRRHGDCWLLEVVEADERHPVGHVELVADGILRGRIEQFAPYDAAGMILPDAWAKLCRNAAALVDRETPDGPPG